MYKVILQTILSLGTSPIPSWKRLAEKNTSDSTEFLNKFFYPLLGLTTLATFVGILWNRKGFELEYALKSASLTLMTLFAAFFLSSFVLNKLFVRFFKQADNLQHTQHFVGYVLSFSYVIHMLMALLPALFFLKFGVLYIPYIIWVGSESFIQIEEKNRIRFMVITTAVLFILPSVIEKVLLFLMPRLS
ncbi:MAG: hypothetical protein RR212_05360 [Bacteroidales bacterium]